MSLPGKILLIHGRDPDIHDVVAAILPEVVDLPGALVVHEAARVVENNGVPSVADPLDAC